MNKFFISFCYVGFLKPAPGTIGSLAGLLISFFILKISANLLLFLALIFTIIGIKAIDKFEKISNEHDSSFIVIDEVVGVFLSIYLSHSSTLAIILSFIFFRIFDITKPSFIGRVDKNVKGGLGVMLDDILAGFCAGAFSLLAIEILKKIA